MYSIDRGPDCIARCSPKLPHSCRVLVRVGIFSVRRTIEAEALVLPEQQKNTAIGRAGDVHGLSYCCVRFISARHDDLPHVFRQLVRDFLFSVLLLT